MATESQVKYYEYLCEELGQEPDDQFESVSTEDASTAIKELLELYRQY